MKKPVSFATFAALVLLLLTLGNPAIRSALAQTGVANTAAELAGKYLMVRDADETVTGLKTFSRSTNPPFAVNSGAAKVTNLDADKIDGLDSTVFTTVASTVTTTGTITALPLPSAGGSSVIYMNNGSLATIQGIVAGTVDGQLLTVYSIGAGQVDFVHQSGSATAALRLINDATSGVTSLAAGSGVATYTYDLSTARWRLRTHEQGDWIEYSGSSTVVGWTSFTSESIKYYLRGRHLSIYVDLEGTSNATTVTFTTLYTFGAATTTRATSLIDAIDNGGSDAAGLLRSQSGSVNKLEAFSTVGRAAWTGSGTKQIIGLWIGQVT